MSATRLADEKSLLEALSRGEREAAERLVEATYRKVFGALSRLTGGDVDLAADLTQETYRKAWRSLSSFDGRSAFFTWLYRIAYTTFLNHVRRPRPVTTLGDPADPSVVDPHPSQEDRLAEAAEVEELREAVLGLSEELRLTVTARFWGELPVKEIARLEGITPMAVRKRLRRAFHLMRTQLEGGTR